MRHKKYRYELNRFTSWRKATLKSMARSLLISESIKTTLTKAKAARPLIEELINLAKQGTLIAKRRAYEILCEHKLVKRLFEDIGPRFKERNGGYTRIINFGNRRGDNAKLAIFELVEIKKKEKKRPKKKEKIESAPVAQQASPDKEKEIEKPQKKIEKQAAVKEKPPIEKKPSKKFLGGLKNIFKKERDSL